MIKFLTNIIFASEIKKEAKNKALRYNTFLAVYDNPKRANGCFGWTLKINSSK